MKVAIVGHCMASRQDAAVIALEMRKLIEDPDTQEIWIPGLDGVAATALCFALAFRAESNKTTPLVFTVFPGRYGERPPWSVGMPSPEERARQANQIYELGGDMTSTWNHRDRTFAWELSIRACNEYVVGQVAGAGQAIVFWNGSLLETKVARAVEKAQAHGIPWLHVPVSGDEDE